jgi:AcrR family transcriptional regulator
MNSGQKKQLPKQEKRDVILQASWKLIHQYGYQKTTIDDIARTAGIAKGTIYLYFRSKSEIMLALVDLTNLRIADEQDRIAEKDDPAVEKLRACLKHRIMTLFDIINRHPHGEEMITSLLPDIVHRLDWYVTRQGELLGKIIAEGCADRVFDVADPKKTGQLLARLFEHLTPPYYRFGSRKSLEQFTDQLLDLLSSGLWTRKPNTAKTSPRSKKTRSK